MNGKPKVPVSEAIPDDLLDFFKAVHDRLQSVDINTLAVGEDIVQQDTAYGGKLDEERFVFTYFPDDSGLDRWDILVTQQQIAQIASGKQSELPLHRCDSPVCGNRFPIADAVCEDCDGLFALTDFDSDSDELDAEPMLIWGLESGEAELIESVPQLDELLDLMAAVGRVEQPRLLRVIRENGDRMVIGLALDEVFLCAISEDMDSPLPMHATTLGNDAQVETTEFRDIGEPISLMFKYFVPWKAGRQAIREFLSDGVLSEKLTWEQSMPGDWESESRLLLESHPPAAYRAHKTLFSPPPHALTLEKARKLAEKAPKVMHSSGGDVDAELTQQALRFLGLLLESEHLELTDGADPSSLAEGVAPFLVGEGSPGRRAEGLVTWLFDQENVEEVYIGDEELARLIAMW